MIKFSRWARSRNHSFPIQTDTESQPPVWDAHVRFTLEMNMSYGELNVKSAPEAFISEQLSLAPPHTLPNLIVINFFARLWWNAKPRKHGFGRFGLYGHYNPPKPAHFAHWRFIIIEDKWNLTGRKDSHVRLHMWDLHWKSYWTARIHVQVHMLYAFSRIYAHVCVKSLNGN